MCNFIMHVPIFIIIEFNPSIHRDLIDTHIIQLDETPKNGSNSNCNFKNVRHPTPVKLIQTKFRYKREMSLR